MTRMIVVNIREMAERAGITTSYGLMKVMNVSPSLAAKWWTNNMKMIGISTLNKLCIVLKCQPGDILTFTDEPAPGPTKRPQSKRSRAPSNTVRTRLG